MQGESTVSGALWQGGFGNSQSGAAMDQAAGEIQRGNTVQADPPGAACAA